MSAEQVEVMRRYSNRPDLLKSVQEVLQRIEERDQTDEPEVVSTGRVGGLTKIRDRLNEADVREIVARFNAGEAKHRLAKEYGMSLSSMKTLLRRYR